MQHTRPDPKQQCTHKRQCSILHYNKGSSCHRHVTCVRKHHQDTAAAAMPPNTADTLKLLTAAAACTSPCGPALAWLLYETAHEANKQETEMRCRQLSRHNRRTSGTLPPGAACAPDIQSLLSTYDRAGCWLQTWQPGRNGPHNQQLARGARACKSQTHNGMHVHTAG